MTLIKRRQKRTQTNHCGGGPCTARDTATARINIRKPRSNLGRPKRERMAALARWHDRQGKPGPERSKGVPKLHERGAKESGLER